MPQSAARVGIVGAGIAGCSLAKVLKETGLAVTVFEMGRGAGGRMATRKSREIPGLAINHGAPVRPTWFPCISPGQHQLSHTVPCHVALAAGLFSIARGVSSHVAPSD